MSQRLFRAMMFALLLGTFAITASAQDANQDPQTLPIKLGTSGGNVNDINSQYCCSGTLGALVQKGGGLYILSNNHVLALSGSGSSGDDISQPGLIDNGCRVYQVVADLSGTGGQPGDGNVDAAIASTDSSKASAEIIGIGVPSSSPATPALNMGVAKSGRTTGLTCASIGSISTDVNVQYQDGCGIGDTFIVSYRDQVVINNARFSAGGDSGSLIVTSDGARPVALLYAGSSRSTIANPIQDVISHLGISFVGGSGAPVAACAKKGGGKPRNLTSREAGQAKRAKESARGLMQEPGIQGVGIGQDERTGEPVVVVYVIEGREHSTIPAFIEGVKTQVIRGDRFRAYGWNEAMGGACKAKK